jgi:hypothetical protein
MAGTSDAAARFRSSIILWTWRLDFSASKRPSGRMRPSRSASSSSSVSGPAYAEVEFEGDSFGPKPNEDASEE